MFLTNISSNIDMKQSSFVFQFCSWIESSLELNLLTWFKINRLSSNKLNIAANETDIKLFRTLGWGQVLPNPWTLVWKEWMIINFWQNHF